jgi:hypothetical protein
VKLLGFALLLSAVTAPLAAQEPVPPIVTRGLVALRDSGYEEALDIWVSDWTGPTEVGKRAQLAAAFAQISQFAGPVLLYDLVRVVDVSPHLKRIYVLLGYERQPAYMLIVVYKPAADWKVVTLTFNTDARQVFPASLLDGAP